MDAIASRPRAGHPRAGARARGRLLDRRRPGQRARRDRRACRRRWTCRRGRRARSWPLARLGGVAPAVDGLALAMAGETASGDAWATVRDGALHTILLADGLGHGDDAATAANAAVRELRDRAGRRRPARPACTARCGSTRGAAAAIARCGPGAAGALDYAGIGNIAATIVDGGETRSLVSMPGHPRPRLQRPRTFDYELPPGALLVMHSDGLRSGWDLSALPRRDAARPARDRRAADPRLRARARRRERGGGAGMSLPIGDEVARVDLRPRRGRRDRAPAHARHRRARSASTGSSRRASRPRCPSSPATRAATRAAARCGSAARPTRCESR